MMKNKPKRVCRVCGCTDDNCSQCVAAQGKTCYWIEDDLCSRCAVCENCGTNKKEDEVRISEVWWIDSEKHEGIKLLCGQCEDELWIRCDCEALIDVDSYGEGIPEDYEGEPLCPECAAKEFFECSECGNSALAALGEERLCKKCYEEQSDADF